MKVTFRDPATFDAAEVNAAASWLAKEFNGGSILIDGRGVDLAQSVPIVGARGVHIRGKGVPNINGRVRTRLVPKFSEAAQFVQDNRTGSSFEAWGAGEFSRLVGKNKDRRPGMRLLDVIGGNHSLVQELYAQGNDYEYGVRIVEGRVHDAQYSHYVRLGIWGAKYPIHIGRNVPDIDFWQCTTYGTQKGGSSAPEPGSINVYVGSNSVRFYEHENQFTNVGWYINGSECHISGGAWEAYSGWSKGAAETAFKLGSRAEYLSVVGHSFANLGKARDRITAHPDASYASFLGCTRLKESHVRPEFHKWVTFQKA
jgi:hypothetical protein